MSEDKSKQENADGTSDDLPEVLMLKDVAKVLRCSESTIKRGLRAKVFPVPAIARDRQASAVVQGGGTEVARSGRIEKRAQAAKTRTLERSIQTDSEKIGVRVVLPSRTASRFGSCQPSGQASGPFRTPGLINEYRVY